MIKVTILPTPYLIKYPVTINIRTFHDYDRAITCIRKCDAYQVSEFNHIITTLMNFVLTRYRIKNYKIIITNSGLVIKCTKWWSLNCSYLYISKHGHCGVKYRIFGFLTELRRYLYEPDLRSLIDIFYRKFMI